MHMLKSAAYILPAFVFILVSCVTTVKVPREEIPPLVTDKPQDSSGTIRIPESAAEFSKSVMVTISGVTGGVLANGRNATDIDLVIENRSAEPLSLSSVLFPLEAVFAGPDAKISYVVPEVSAANSAASRVFIVPGTAYPHTVRFYHAEEDSPAALVKDRVPFAVFMPESDRRYKVLRAELDRQAAIPTCFYLARLLPYESVAEYMREHGLSGEETDRQGHTLLYQAVMYNNISLVHGLLENGANVRAPVYRNGLPIFPVHLAVLMANTPLTEELMRFGASLTESADGGESPAALAVRENNLKALKLLDSFGVPLSQISVRQTGGEVVPALLFARKNKMPDIVSFLSRFE